MLRLSPLDKLLMLRALPLTLAVFWLAPLFVGSLYYQYRVPLVLTPWDGGAMLVILAWLSAELYMTAKHFAGAL